MNNSLLIRIRETLVISSDEKTRQSSQHYFKESILCHGVKSAAVGRIGKEFYKSLPDVSKETVYGLCDELWKTGYLEESFIACNWSYFQRKAYQPEDFKTFERWVSNYITNWAACDTLCNHTVGTFIEMYPSFLSDLKKWALSENRWMRRASAVSLIVPARKGKFLKDILEIADILLLDKDDMVQKGYGWMLKAASEAHQQTIFDYVMEKKTIMPRTSLRYAIEKMPDELREIAMTRVNKPK
jgi:3-methyladenine DNA glycosylase AlkD